MQNYIKRLICFTLAMFMILTMPLETFASGFRYYNIPSEKYNYINDMPVDDAAEFVDDPQTKEEADNEIKDVDPPALYTLRADFKIQRGGDETKNNDQPYIATVGENATVEEKKKVEKDVYLKDMDGYTTPTPKFHLSYDYIKNRANKAENKAKDLEDPIFKNSYLASHPYIYQPKQRPVLVKHVFQSLYDKSKYGGITENSAPIERKQYGETGTNITVSSLPSEERVGFAPESSVISTRVPESLDNFYIEYRYNREKYNVVYDTSGGSPIPARTLYFGQTIPEVDKPTKVGGIFKGWKSDHDITYVNDQNIKVTIKAGELIPNQKSEFKEAMPANNIKFTAVWDSETKADYTILYYVEKPDHEFGSDNPDNIREKYDFVGARVIDNADTGSQPNLEEMLPEGVTFPDLEGQSASIVNNKENLNKYYTYNADLTKKKNEIDEAAPNGTVSKVQKKVDSNGETTYEVFYDRTVYTLVFEKAKGKRTFDPEITVYDTKTKQAKIYDYNKGTEPYTITARFGESLANKWVRDGNMGDDYVKNIFKGEQFPYISKGYSVNRYSQGWCINRVNTSTYRDTPPYRLTKSEFIDIDRTPTSPSRKDGSGNLISYVGKNIISLGIAQSSRAGQFMPHHIEFNLEEIDGSYRYHPELYYWKSDTNQTYSFQAPELKGFIKPQSKKSVKKEEAYFENLNASRPKGEKTPFAFQKELMGKSFTFNGYIPYSYQRKSYTLYLNSDPTIVKEDSAYTGKTFSDGSKQQQSVKFDKPLADLSLPILKEADEPQFVKEANKHGLDYEFKGWALDPAGVNMVQDAKTDKEGNVSLVKNPKARETMPDYNKTLYAIWSEKEPIWTLKVDPNGGSLRQLVTSDFNLTSKNKDDKIEDIFEISKDKSTDKVQAFDIKHRTKINSILAKPTRQGYDFLGWELVRFKDDGSEDKSYYDKYKLPELYAFGNDLVSDIYLRAIWVENRLVDITAYHHFFDSEGKELTGKLQKQTLVNRRIGSYTSAVAREQGEQWTLMTEKELENVQSYKDYKKTAKDGDSKANKFFQVMKVDDPKIEDPNNKGQFIDNPNANNVFHFYYRAFRTRKYKVNYLDERIKKIANPTADDIKKYSIIPQEEVENGNRHFDARNFRSISGWKLTSDPQQQLFFDLDEKGELVGINGSGKDEINFYYKDVRVIKRKSIDSPTPDGYVRVIFQTEKGDNPGGSFGKNADNSPIREVVYDVIEGLMSDNIIVPQEKKTGDNPDPNKIYITPDPGRKFIKWDKQRLLNENTVLRSGTPYVFTAYFEWSGLKINDLVKTESFKDGDKWVNNFVPTEDELKGALSWITNGKEGPLPSGVSVTIEEKPDGIYKKVKELDKKDSEELVRTDKVKAKVNFGNGSVQTIEIPVKIYKNVYEALTTGSKPKILVDAEREDLKDITGSYVKVTVNPTGRPNEKDSKIYYVNKNANVVIPEVILSEEEKAKLGFTNWTADKDAQNEGQKANGVFDFAKRHKFTEDTVISPGFAQDVIPQEGEDKPKSVPDYFVKVTFIPTDKATDTGDKIYWVNPNNEVTIDIADPMGKDAYSFIEWKIDDKAYSPKTAKKFDRETVVTADYSKSEDIIEYDPKYPKTKPDGYVRVTFEGEDGLNLSKVKAYFVKKNKNISLFNNEKIIFPTVTAKTGYEHNGWDKEDGTLITDQDLVVKAKSKELPNTIEVKQGTKQPDKYVKVTFTTEDASKGQVKEKSYYVNPENFVKLTPPTGNEITANTGYEFATWDFDATQYQNYKEDKTIKAGFNELDNIYSEAKPGYNLVQFEITGEGGSILTGETIKYYVNPNVNVKVPAPKVVEEIGYKFSGWNPNPNEERVYSEPITTIKGTLKKLDDIVPGTNSVKYPGYIEVKFLPGTEGSFTSGETIYYVNPRANKALAELTKPSAKGNTGYKFEGKWDKEDTTQLTENIEVTAKYTEVPDVIPKTKEEETEKPDGYIKVLFITTEKGKIKDTEKTEKILYVNPNKAVVLDDFKPIVTANTGYTHAGWDISISKAIQYKDNDKITAQYNELGNIYIGKKNLAMQKLYLTKVKMEILKVKLNIGSNQE